MNPHPPGRGEGSGLRPFHYPWRGRRGSNVETEPSEAQSYYDGTGWQTNPSSNGVEAWTAEELEAHNQWQWQEHVRAFPSSDTDVDEHLRRFEQASLTTAGVKALKPPQA